MKKSIVKAIHSTFQSNLEGINKVYEVAVFGANQRTKDLLKKEIQRILKEKSNDISSEDISVLKGYTSSMDTAELLKIEQLVRKYKIAKTPSHDLHHTKNVRVLVLEQSVISLAALFEALTGDLINTGFEVEPRTLKTTKATLTDEELIDSLDSGETLKKIREVRIRDIMYNSYPEWMSFFIKKFGLEVAINPALSQLFLVRNSLVHNKKVVSPDLARIFPEFKLGNPMRITEDMYQLYLNEAADEATKLCDSLIAKFKITD